MEPPTPAIESPFRYPLARILDVVDDYHGTKVADPYRWLEEADHPDTAAWVEAQNTLTRSVLDGPERDRLVARLTDLYDYPRVSVPFKRGSRYFQLRNAGLQNQALLFVQESLDDPGRVLLDPNALSPDGTTALTGVFVNHAGTLLVYALSESGSDRQVLAVRDVASGADLPDRLEWAKFTTVAWLHDGSGFYYVRFPEPGSVAPGDEHYFCQVFFHRLGAPQSEDRLVLDRPDDKEVVFGVDISDEGRHLVITASKGSSDKCEVFVLRTGGDPTAAPRAVFTGFRSTYEFIDAVGDRLFFSTDQGALLGRIIAVDLPDSAFASPGLPAVLELVPETTDRLRAALLVKHELVAVYLHNAADRLRRFHLDGGPIDEIRLPAIGTIGGMDGRLEDDEFFVQFSSFTQAPTIYRYDFPTATLHPFAPTTPKVEPGAYETRQVWYASKDGTRVSMFLVHRKDVVLDGLRPTWLSGYGGFNHPMTPGYDPSAFVWLDRGGVMAVANLRGGGEYGEAWHEAGMFERKQNVFDDFIAAAEWLIANRYASPSTLAIEGGSNGGLLVAAVEVQRPDLFGAVICRVPVADMLRYHLFTVGRFWISEYGCADDPSQFPYLYRYSPYHNIREGVAFPATLVMTADTDDRVSPAMAKKFAARLQQANAGSSPILIRVETKAGHGAGKPVSKVIDEDADVFQFLFRYLGKHRG